MDLTELRSLIIASLCADPILSEELVLKGGNALDLVHLPGMRSSIDVDFSIEDDFKDIEDTRARLKRAVQDGFAKHGIVVFDLVFGPRPPEPGPDPRWGGYSLEFKLMDRASYEGLGENLQKKRIRAHPVGPESQKRTFQVQISKYEYCGGKERAKVGGIEVYVYSPAMAAAEKLRAICQNMPQYGKRRAERPRARDFYDIRKLVEDVGVDLESVENLKTVRAIFAAKDVPLKFLREIGDGREFHRPDWTSVMEATREEALREEDFDEYFEFTVRLADRILKALGDE